jgi:hypothetical protein
LKSFWRIVRVLDADQHEDISRAVAFSAGGDGGRKSPEHQALLAFAQYLFDSLHDWHLEIFLVAAIVRHFAHIFFEALQIKHSVIAFGIVVTAEPRGDEPRLTNFVMHELATVDFRNVDCHLGLGRPGGPKGKDGYQGDAHAFPCHKEFSSSRNRNFGKRPIGGTYFVNDLEHLGYSGVKMGRSQ